MKIVRRTLLAISTLLVVLESTAATAADSAFTRREDVIYGRKYGSALTMDVFTPKARHNGSAVIMIISGGFFSSHDAINPGFFRPLLDRGYTVFAVVHGSQPKFTIPEIIQDLKRSVRFIRHHAKEFAIDPDRVGVMGASAGGHLALMLGTAGDVGDPKAKDPVDCESSRVQAVACFCPGSDFLNFGKPGEHALGRGRLEAGRAAFDFQELDPSTRRFRPIVDESEILRIGRDISPVTHVSPDDAPTLILHGDKDPLVPIQQAELMVQKLKAAGVEAKLVVKEGAEHSWPGMGQDVALFADWFDAHLKASRTADAPHSARVKSRAYLRPRKVVVGTVIFGPYGQYPGLDQRLKELGGFVDAMAREGASKYPGRGLDLAILPETIVTSTAGPSSDRAIPLAGRVSEFFGALARKHRCYLVVPMDLAENGPTGPRQSNAAVLFDRSGQVAGVYRKIHPVALVGSDALEGGITPGPDVPVFDCDFGKLGIQICWDIVFEDGWRALAERRAEIVAWPSASPATAQPSARAARHRYYIVSSTWRDNATVYEPTGLVAARVQRPEQVLVQQLDLSFAVLGWSAPLRNGQALTETFGDRVGFHYETREDLGLFWSNDPKTPIGEMIRSLGLEEIDAQIERNRRLQDAARGGSVK